MSTEDLLKYGAELQLDTDRFVVDLTSHAHAGRIQRDLDSGDESGVMGIPTLSVNGRKHEGRYDPVSLLSALRAAGA